MGNRQQQLSFMPRKRARGGGRKPTGERAGVSHDKRPELSSRDPVHVTLKTVPEVGKLRTKTISAAVRRALQCSMGWSRTRGKFRVCQVSVQGDHIHMLVEAADKRALSRGMQGFMISCAKQINAELRDANGKPRRGRVFADRYHSRILRTPREVRACLNYVLGNWRHHGFDKALPRFRLDPYATGLAFDGWCDLRRPELVPIGEPGFLVWFPKTWLLDKGWRRHGLLDPWAVPG